jgi:hypothetical protein
MSVPPHIASSADAVVVDPASGTAAAADVVGAGMLASLVSMVAVVGGVGAVFEFPEPQPTRLDPKANAKPKISARSCVVTRLA